MNSTVKNGCCIVFCDNYNKNPHNGHCYNNYADAEPKPQNNFCYCNKIKDEAIRFANYIKEQNLMICEGNDGKHYRSSMIGGKKFTTDELYEQFKNLL